MCLPQGHNAVTPVMLERSRIKHHRATALPKELFNLQMYIKWINVGLKLLLWESKCKFTQKNLVLV